MRKFLVICMIILAFSVAILAKEHKKRSDAYLRDRVVMLHSDKGSCSGVLVKAPSGKVLILTAAHCRALVDDFNTVKARDEAGKEHTVMFVAEDSINDLMLLTADNMKVSIDVAEKVVMYEHVHTMTHGGAKPSYRTDGELLDNIRISVPIFGIGNDEDLHKCSGQQKLIIMFDFFGPVCAMNIMVERATAAIIPGSSGGPLLNEANDLVGIVSAGDGQGDYAFVPLKDIQRFLRNR
jgi:hypothetical protein